MGNICLIIFLALFGLVNLVSTEIPKWVLGVAAVVTAIAIAVSGRSWGGKRIPLIFLALFGLPALCFAATNDPPTNEFPKTASQFWDYGIALVSPVIVWAVRKIVPSVPSMVLPMLTPFIGIGLGLLLNWLAGANLEWVDMAKAGALAVFIREVVNQAITQPVQEKLQKIQAS